MGCGAKLVSAWDLARLPSLIDIDFDVVVLAAVVVVVVVDHSALLLEMMDLPAIKAADGAAKGEEFAVEDSNDAEKEEEEEES